MTNESQKKKIVLPELLNIPPKLLPLITEFNKYDTFNIHGGRGSAKTQSTGRVILYIAEKRKVRVVCGRETQASIEESVYTVLCDLIREYDLDFKILGNKIIHNRTGSTIRFKGFREQGKINIKGLEGVDILWVDEAQALAKATVDTLEPTIRKDNAKVIYTYNRFMEDDAVHAQHEHNPRAKVIHINFNENPFCPQRLKSQAEETRKRNIKEYEHIWMGEPLAAASDILISSKHIKAALAREPFGHTAFKQRVIGFDFAAQGDDMCVATTVDRLSDQHWGVEDTTAWASEDTAHSIGKIVHIMGRMKPDLAVLDIGGMGKVVYDRLAEMGYADNIIPFDGARTPADKTDTAVNLRAKAYLTADQMFQDGMLCLDINKCNNAINELKKIKFRYRSNGKKLIWSKQELKKAEEIGHSPDYSDSLVYALYATLFVGDPQYSSPHGGKGRGLRRKATRRALRGNRGLNR